jgi:hypothetical protein
VWLSLTAALWLGGAALSVVPIMMSAMIFNGPPNPPTMTAFVCLATFPLVAVGSVALSWLLYALRLTRAAVACSLLPLANVAVGVGAVVCIYVFHDGNIH